jgi:thymidylate synthase (FAD)
MCEGGQVKIIEPSATLIRPQTPENGIIALKAIESMARISHKSEERQTDDSWKRFLEAVVLQHGDWSVVEHGVASVLFRVDRGITHELVRHRLFSFTQESTRFVNGRKSYPEGLEFIKPLVFAEGTEVFDQWAWSMTDAERRYFDMLEMGTRPQEARAVLPNSLAATIGMTGNFRSWRHFLIMRTTKETHPDMLRVTVPLLRTFQERIPLLFADIFPGYRQIYNMRLPQ